jgi:outer membrane protein TolC
MQVFSNKAGYAGLALALGCYNLGLPPVAEAGPKALARHGKTTNTRGQKAVNYARRGDPISGSRPIRQISGSDLDGLPLADPTKEEGNAPQPPVGDQQDEMKFVGVQKKFTPIDLRSALQLAGVRNLDLVVAQQRVELAVAEQQLAAAQILPNFNFGANYDYHTGVLQQSSSNILALKRSSLYVGAGAGAVAAGTVPIPGLQYNLNLSESIFKYLVNRKTAQVAHFERRAMENQVLLKVTLGYSELLRAEGTRSVAVLARNDAQEVARLTAAYAKTGEGRQSDADRAATELARRNQDVYAAEARVAEASWQLCQILNLDMSLLLAPVESQMVPQSVVPTQIPMPELLAIALLERPELQARRAAVEAALLELDSAKILPFSPQILGGFSGGEFGGGSNIIHGGDPERFGVGPGVPRFGAFKGRTDMDIVFYWSLKNMGLGNKAQIDTARARLKGSQFEELAILDKVREDVAGSYALTHARFEEIARRARGVRTGMNALKEDFIRVRGREGLPIEVLDSVRQLARTRQEYLDAIVEFNKSQFQLYVSLGSPPADSLARPIPQDFEQTPVEEPATP